ncbi:nucleotide sugar dehydrogenase [Maritimibacter sp. 55A14]|uniref:nucleotide sugar dehydrogenase n=1 Tax=Maritimibacter sp. 55A14 TaxID=2174844 RepID=UPI000D611095|nr:nucleotide sugar dehydrogenase [Maritimibacter sp. 55A14]PWE32931.1 nucleotide sugar dehydrogenase [Maritimibacter sp. 55A14]
MTEETMDSIPQHYSALQDRIARFEARVAVVGLGYVGLPLALTACETGFDTTGVDVDAGRVARINAAEHVISYMPGDRITRAVEGGRFRASSDPADLTAADIVLICVPTPLDAQNAPDLSFVTAAAREIARRLRPGQLVVLESTVWPGATAQVLRPILEESGLRAGRDFFLGFSPEREDPGNHDFNTQTIPKVVGADDPQSLALVEQFYNAIVARAVPVSSSACAEAVKLVENSFRTVNIALVNEMKVALDAMGVDIWEVVAAASTKPFGYMPFYPGPGIGGACIPVSPAYLSWRAGDVGSATPMIDLARSSNDAVPGDLAARTCRELGLDAEGAAPLAGRRILLMGIAYKRDVEDTRRSPALALLDRLEEMGAQVDYHDPYFPRMAEGGEYPHLAGRMSADLTEAALAGYDAVIVTTDHSAPDYALVARAAPLVLDSRNVFAKLGLTVAPGRLVKV